MITRRSLAGLAAGAALLPSLANAQTWTPRRTESFTEGFPAPGRRPWAEQVPQLRIGLMGGENEADRLGRFGAYRDLLERTFGVPTRL
ncbi:MAG: phosphate/phosphite/phosphonate ABC transporter substrate-binding protein, partial [Roseomonas sp.]|nr:phosphate/phosphite/phosphonate ABC transporter substrate-binding protein [Roseomonas sp.]